MSRLEAITARIQDEGLAALLVTTPANTYYLSRFQAETYTRPIGDILIYSNRQAGRPRGLSHLHLALGLAVEALKDAGVGGPIGFESEGLSAEGFFTLRGRTPARIVPTRGIVEELRMVKDADELELISAEATTAMMREGAARHPGCHVKTVSRPTSGPRSDPVSPAARWTELRGP